MKTHHAHDSLKLSSDMPQDDIFHHEHFSKLDFCVS
jgi:hypothetical protein